MTVRQRARLRNSAAAFAFLACALWLAISTINPPALARQGAPQPAALSELARLVTPAELTVAGLTPAQAQSVLQSVAGEHAETIAALRQGAQQSDAHAEALSAAQDVLFRGGATTERLATREAAQAVFDAAAASHRAARAQLREALYGGIADAVGSENAALGRRWADNALRKVPDQFKALDIGDEAWRALESAWRRHQRGEDLSGAQASALAAALSSSVAAVAEQRLGAVLPAMSAWAADALGAD